MLEVVDQGMMVAGNGGNTPVTLSGIQAGDLIIYYAANSTHGINIAKVNMVTPGFTMVRQDWHNGSGNDGAYRFFAKIADGTETTIEATGSLAGADSSAGFAIAYRNHTIENVLDIVSTSTKHLFTHIPVPAPQTPTVAGSKVLMIASCYHSAFNMSWIGFGNATENYGSLVRNDSFDITIGAASFDSEGGLHTPTAWTHSGSTNGNMNTISLSIIIPSVEGGAADNCLMSFGGV